LTENNELYIVGRKKEIIRVGSYTVLPSEVEEVMLQHPNVAVAAAVGVPHPVYGEVVWAFIVPKVGTEVSEEEIISLCKEKLADFKVPRKVIIRKSLPITRLGKVHRVFLKEEAAKMLEKEKKT